MNQQQLLELNASKSPIVESDFFKWLGEHGDAKGFRMDNLKNYLNSKGTSPPISEELLTNLKGIHEHFYWIKFKARNFADIQ